MAIGFLHIPPLLPAGDALINIALVHGKYPFKYHPPSSKPPPFPPLAKATNYTGTSPELI